MTDFLLKGPNNETWILHGADIKEAARKMLLAMFGIEVVTKGILTTERVLERVRYRKVTETIKVGKSNKTVEVEKRDVLEEIDMPSGGVVEALRQRGWVVL